MRKLLKRCYVWLGLVLLLGLAASATLILASAGRINQANCDRIDEGMTTDQVEEILGQNIIAYSMPLSSTSTWIWMDGPDVITISVDADGKVLTKAYNSPTALHRLRWHANDLLFKLGISRE
jgi:hypothetical protein